MELREIVNAATETGSPAEPVQVFSRDSIHPMKSTSDVFLPRPPQPLKSTSKSRVLGPCLYIGPAGQRCNCPAGESGFCSKHGVNQQDDTSSSLHVKRGLAVIGVLAALWPFIAELVRELLRLLR